MTTALDSARLQKQEPSLAEVLAQWEHAHSIADRRAGKIEKLSMALLGGKTSIKQLVDAAWFNPLNATDKTVKALQRHHRPWTPEPVLKALDYLVRQQLQHTVDNSGEHESPEALVQKVVDHWESLNEADRQPYYDLEGQDRQRYLDELAFLHCFREDQRLPEVERTVRVVKRKHRATNIKHEVLLQADGSFSLSRRPKQPRGPFLFYRRARTPELREEDKDISFLELSRKLGMEWKSLTAEDRKRFEDMAAQDKARYKQEKMAWAKKKESVLGSSPLLGDSQNGVDKEDVIPASGGPHRSGDTPFVVPAVSPEPLLAAAPVSVPVAVIASGDAIIGVSEVTEDNPPELVGISVPSVDCPSSRAQSYDLKFGPPIERTVELTVSLLEMNAIQRPLSGFLHFLRLQRPRFSEHFPSRSFRDIARITGQLWKSIPGSERRKYDIVCAYHKEKYRRARALFQKLRTLPVAEQRKVETVNIVWRRVLFKRPKQLRKRVRLNRSSSCSANAGDDNAVVVRDKLEVKRQRAAAPEVWSPLEEAAALIAAKEAADAVELQHARIAAEAEVERERKVIAASRGVAALIAAEEDKAPTRARSAYELFALDETEAILEIHPDVDRGELDEALREQWAELSEHEKAPYCEQAVDDQRRFEDEYERAASLHAMAAASLAVNMQDVPGMAAAMVVHLSAVPALLPATVRPIQHWSSVDVAAFVASEAGLPIHSQAFQASGISGGEFIKLSNNQMKSDFGIISLGERKRLRASIDRLLGKTL